MTGSWLLLALALALVIGWSLTSLKPLFRGLAVGLSLSSAVAVTQALGMTEIVILEKPAGFFFNSTIQAAAIALVIIAIVCQRDWRYIPAMLPGLWLAHSRGGWLVLLAGLVSRFFGWQALLLTVSIAAAASLSVMGPSDIDRIMIWSVAWRELTWLGHGAGSFANMLFQADDGIHYPGHVHNDYLQLAYEIGLWAIPLYLVYAAALARTSSLYWPAFVGFAVAGMFFFPLYTPVPAFIGAVLAGHVLRGTHYRAVVLPRSSIGKRAYAAAGNEIVGVK